jgi:hypothetical protein
MWALSRTFLLTMRSAAAFFFFSKMGGPGIRNDRQRFENVAVHAPLLAELGAGAQTDPVVRKSHPRLPTHSSRLVDPEL